jgi:hypothetical protein
MTAIFELCAAGDALHTVVRFALAGPLPGHNLIESQTASW